MSWAEGVGRSKRPWTYREIYIHIYFYIYKKGKDLAFHHFIASMRKVRPITKTDY